MRDMLRVRRITKPDGSSPYDVDGRVIITALARFNTLNMTQPILQNSATLQSLTVRQFSVTFVGKIYEPELDDMREFFDDLIGEKSDPSGNVLSEGALGMRNRRFYLYDDRFWFVRHEGTYLITPYAGVRTKLISLELYCRMLDPYLYDEAGNKYGSW